MARRIAYQESAFAIAFARDASGDCPACEFFDELELLDKAKLMALFRIAGDHGRFTHGFVKKKDKTPREEITRARRILEEDQAGPKPAIVRKAKG
jgi:hypothetical protein